jgi:hypothetical protein
VLFVAEKPRNCRLLLRCLDEVARFFAAYYQRKGVKRDLSAKSVILQIDAAIQEGERRLA